MSPIYLSVPSSKVAMSDTLESTSSTKKNLYKTASPQMIVKNKKVYYKKKILWIQKFHLKTKQKEIIYMLTL